MAIPSIISGVGNNISLIILEEEVVNRGGGNEDRRDVGERTGGTITVERFVWEFHMDNVIGSAEDAKLEEAKKNANLTGATNDIDIEECLQFSANKCDTDLVVEARSQLERNMRECLLRVIALRKRRRRKNEKPENMSFKLCMEVAEEKKKQSNNVGGDGEEAKEATRDANSCPELMDALQRGEWHLPEQSSCLFSKKNTNGNVSQSTKGLLRPIKDVNLPSCGMKMTMSLGMEVDPSDRS